MCRAFNTVGTAAPERRERSGYKVALTAADADRARARNRRCRAFVAERKNFTPSRFGPEFGGEALEQRMNRNRTAGLGRTREVHEAVRRPAVDDAHMRELGSAAPESSLARKWRHKLLKSFDPRPGLARSLQQDQAADETAHLADTMRADWKCARKLLKMRDSGTGLAGPSHCRTDEPSAGPRRPAARRPALLGLVPVAVQRRPEPSSRCRAWRRRCGRRCGRPDEGSRPRTATRSRRGS